MDIYIENNKILGIISNVVILFIVLILIYNKDKITNIHVVFIFILVLLFILKNILIN